MPNTYGKERRYRLVVTYEGGGEMQRLFPNLTHARWWFSELQKDPGGVIVQAVATRETRRKGAMFMPRFPDPIQQVLYP